MKLFLTYILSTEISGINPSVDAVKSKAISGILYEEIKDEFIKRVNSMKKLQFKENIQAPANKVYDIMLGINNKSTYEQ